MECYLLQLPFLPPSLCFLKPLSVMNEGLLGRVDSLFRKKRKASHGPDLGFFLNFI